MEIAGVVIHRVSMPPCCKNVSLNRSNGNHRQQLRITCGENKEKRKLVKGLKKDLGLFASMRFGIDPKRGLAGGVQESLIMEAAEVIMRQLDCVREAEEEAKRQRKQEKKKHKTKSMLKRTITSQNSKDFNSSLKDQVLSTSTSGREGLSSAAEAVARVMRESLEDRSEQEKQEHDQTRPAAFTPTHSPQISTKVEICMGGKCRKSGGQQLLEEIQTLAAKKENVSVVGCKCMGKCKTSPNVRLSSSNGTPAICSNVQIHDVDRLLSGSM